VLGGVSALLLAAVPSAQVIHVVPGDPVALQNALNAAPAGAAVVVHGGTWGPITISRPVTLIGDPLAVIESGIVPPIALDGSGAGQVTLSSLEVRAGSHNCCAHPPPGITGSGFEELHIFDSAVIADLRGVFGLDGLGYGNSAIDADVPFLLLERSSAVGGGAGIDDACTGSPPGWIPPPAVIGGTVVLIDSGVQGGGNGSFQNVNWPTNAECDPGNCPFLPGGAGIACGTLYYDGSVLPVSGGEGARWSPCAGSFCCQSPPGPAVVASQGIALPDDLAIGGLVGRRLTLILSAPGPLARLLMAAGSVPPSLVPGLGYSFLDPGTTRSLGAVATPGSLDLDIPNTLSLIGRTLAFQLVDPTHGFSEPVAMAFFPQPQRDGPRRR